MVQLPVLPTNQEFILLSILHQLAGKMGEVRGIEINKYANLSIRQDIATTYSYLSRLATKGLIKQERKGTYMYCRLTRYGKLVHEKMTELSTVQEQ